jgi:hypothetical protein
MQSLPALQPEYRDKLVKLLGMLGSDHDGERAAAARLADQHRRKSGLTWGDLVLPLAEDRPRKARKPRKPRKAKPAPPPQPTWQDKAKVIAESILVTAWERNFASGLLAKWHGALTPKQAQCLEKLWRKCGGQEDVAA